MEERRFIGFCWRAGIGLEFWWCDGLEFGGDFEFDYFVAVVRNIILGLAR